MDEPKKKITKRKAARNRIAKVYKKKGPIPKEYDSIEIVLSTINGVQTTKKDATVQVSIQDNITVNNILTDAEVVFKKVKKKDSFIFNISPGADRDESDHILANLEQISDEMLEDGQLF